MNSVPVIDTERTPSAPETRQVPDYDVSTPLDTDYYAVFADVPEADRAFWSRARTFAEESLDELTEAWDKGEYPLHLARRLGELDLLTDAVEGPGLTPMSALAAGLVNMEISRGDGSMGTVVAVQGGLALRSIALFGSAEQKATWLVPLARAEKLGAFALTEPEHGSDSVGLVTSARRDGDEWVINGEKMWIGNGSVGDVTVVWARDEHGDVRGFLVDQATPGYVAKTMTGKGSLRAIHQARIVLDNVRIPLDAVLPGTHTFKDTAAVLYATRLGVAWSALGHATAVFEAALNYSTQRTQFGKPLAGFQLVQERLTVMLSRLTSMQLHCMHLATLDEAGTLRPIQASLAKYHNTRAAREIASLGRDMLGGNGILLENHVVRHMADIEAIHTYEGTESVQALLIGRDLTGVSAFK
ncbi:acyl-CoA dehydrogenase family protein [Cryobacterium psychrophilum]|uniref:Acyl-CoA dehydrogenase n=1 Tax=Cryobacterium psychrophilum TaxID=41988 RepID=A0A4Y8KSB2_9MICO|nr:acyl-CoA dehydrogenase family protein [Cryobacterium psychrophilum]TDW30248.1 glutaryl-CoA dehydrogenase [Cryobacterium psychrophilum]TFD77469.1 acyl-CoA dehydrogenase [Cryobacterium psychrophilum]